MNIPGAVLCFRWHFIYVPQPNQLSVTADEAAEKLSSFFVKVTVGVSRRIHIRGVENVQNVCILRVPESRLWDGD